MMEEIAQRNRALYLAWKARWDQLLVLPPLWEPITLAWHERRWREQRLLARQWLICRIRQRRAAAIAEERWFRRRRAHASTPRML
jgi:hypothetical protein